MLITYSFSLYLIVSTAEIFKSAQFLRLICAHRCMELFRITEAVALKTPRISSQLARRNQNKLVFGTSDFHDFTDRNGSIRTS